VKDSSVLFGLEEQFALRNEAVQELCARNSPIHEATVEMLKSLKGCRLGLVTSSMKSDVEPVLRAAGVLSCFDGAVFGDDVERRKPWPDPYLLAGRLLGIETGLAFEDSDAGIASAENAGFVGIRVDDPEQLDQIVRRAIRDFPNKPIKGPAR
jgi:HAD superfamily hydrolase (TIGR01509 family)